MRGRLRSFLRSFQYAGHGLWLAVKQERNLRFHLCAGAYVFVLSLFYKFTGAEYALLAVLVFGVIALEVLNSAIERAVDYTGTRPSEKARAAKDMAAGAVLVYCVGAVAGGIALFGDLEVLAGVAVWFAARPVLLGVLVVSLVASFIFVFGLGTGKKRQGED